MHEFEIGKTTQYREKTIHTTTTPTHFTYIYKYVYTNYKILFSSHTQPLKFILANTLMTPQS